MGFAYVLKLTRADQHLVRLLIGPIRSARFFLVPWIVLVGFIVNIPIISQTSTAVCLGPVVVPLMRAAGYSFATIGACLLLGASVGGELLNPGAPELLTVQKVTHVTTQEQVARYLPGPVFVQLAVSLAVHGLLASLTFSGLDEATSRQPALAAGFDAFVSKSAPMEVLVAVLRLVERGRELTS